MATLDENAMIDLIPVENDERMTDGNEEVIPESARKTPRKQRQTGIMQFFSLQKRMNKIALGRKNVKCLITTDSIYLRTFALKLFFRPTALLHRDTTSKNRCSKAVAMQ